MAYHQSVWDDMEQLREEMEDAFRHFRRGTSHRKMSSPLFRLFGGKDSLAPLDAREPLADIVEKDKEIIAKVELPGVERQDIKINATDDGIEIKVEKKDEFRDEDRKKGIYRFERAYSGFYRYFQLPRLTDTSKIEASYKNGILELRMPKKEIEGAHTKQITVK